VKQAGMSDGERTISVRFYYVVSWRQCTVGR